MSKIILRISYIIIALALVTLVSWVSRNEALGNKKLGWFGSAISEMSTFPDLFQKSVKEVASMPPTYLKTASDFSNVNRLSKDLIVVNSYVSSAQERIIELKNLKNDSVTYSWKISDEKAKDHFRILNAIPLPDNELCYAWDGHSGPIRVDSEGKEIWRNDEVVVHHSYDLADDSTLWACTYSIDPKGSFVLKGEFNVDYQKVKYVDNAITSFDISTGNILYHKSISELFMENGLEYLITTSQKHSDPLHLNDIEMAEESGDYMLKGDLFLSFRNNSTLLQFRPSTNKIVRFIRGDFSVQHDVDILDGSTILFFNNDATVLDNIESDVLGIPLAKEVLSLETVYSNLRYWHLEDNTISTVGLDSVMNANKIFTATEGLVETLDSTDYFIEENNSGILWVLNKEGVRYKSVLATEVEGYHHLPNWTRIIKYD